MNLKHFRSIVVSVCLGWLAPWWAFAQPVITTQPVNQFRTPGQTALFSVVATGAGLTYQWLFDGTVFKMTPSGALTTLVSFNLANGSYPCAGLVQGSDGNLYGTTAGSGAGGGGTVLKMTPAGVLTTLVSFHGADGNSPQAPLVQGSDGNFYGTTRFAGFGFGGGWGAGTVFKISTNGALTTLYAFGSITNASGEALDGAIPWAALVQGRDGYFYGTTFAGGANNAGTVFRISTNGALTTLYSFGSVQDTNGFMLDGYYPSAALVQGGDGSFYGTTRCGTPNDGGTVFRLTIVPDPQLTIIPSEPYIILTWPTGYNGFSYAGYAVQSTTNLVSPVWTTVSQEPVVIGGQNVVINTFSGAQQFYRLSQ
jgi:uncharacterized repeat protein (TIGR03803 family)